jgi:hypothetical protein
VFENRVLRRIFGSKRGELTVKWRRLRNEVFHVLQSSLNIFRVIKSRRKIWAWHAAQLRTGFWWADLREGDYLERQILDGRIILKWIFKRWDGMHGLD